MSGKSKKQKVAIEAKEGEQLTVKCEDGAVLKGTKFVLRFAYVTANGMDAVYDADPKGKVIRVTVNGNVENMETHGTTVKMNGNVKHMQSNGSAPTINYF